MPEIRPKWLLAAPFTALLIALGTASACNHDDRPSKQQCKELRTHRVELRIRASTRNAEHADAHRKALLRVLGPEEADIARCRERYSRSEIRCALAASSLAELSKCTQATKTAKATATRNNR